MRTKLKDVDLWLWFIAGQDLLKGFLGLVLNVTELSVYWASWLENTR